MQSIRRTWYLQLAVLLVVLLWVAIPVFLIMPFRSQAPWMLTVSYFLERWSPWVTTGGMVVALGLIWRLWSLASGRWQRALAVLALAPMVTWSSASWSTATRRPGRSTSSPTITW